MKIFHSNKTKLDERSKQLRKSIVYMMEKAGRGHPASALSLVEVLRVLYDHILAYDSNNPEWLERDRCILSKGHGCMALYAILADKGFFPKNEMDKFCKKDGILGGHPERKKVPGVEASTGSLGHGLSIGIGMALNAKIDNNNYRVFVITGDGECNEGSIWEAALCAGKHNLSNLTVLVDYNKQQSYGSTSEIQELEPFANKWESFGFAVKEIDGHDVNTLTKSLQNIPFENNKPNVLICHTIKGKGISFMENNLSWHHKSKLSFQDIQLMYQSIEDY